MPILEANEAHELVCLDDGKPIGILCEEVEVVEKIIDILENTVRCRLRVWLDGETFDNVIPRSGLTGRRLSDTLFSMGVNFLDVPENVALLQSFVLDAENCAPCTYEHRRLGFARLDGQLVFLAEHPIGLSTSKKCMSRYRDPTLDEGEKSQEITPVGTFEDWLAVFQEEVQGRTPLELALAVSASSPIVYILREQGAFGEVQIWEFYGVSSSGKTTALRVAASFWGSVREGTGLIKDCDATEAAFFKMLSSRGSYPMIFDETTIANNWQIGDKVYSLSKGIERASCTSSRELKKRNKFSGTVMLSGEVSILDSKAKNLGELSRVCSISLPWTESAEHAERICEKLEKAHGTAAEPYIEYILEQYRQNPESFKTWYKEELQSLRNEFPTQNATEERRYHTFATVIMTAKLVNEALGLSLDVDKIRMLLIEEFRKEDPVLAEARKLYDAVVSGINRERYAYYEKSFKAYCEVEKNSIKGELFLDGTDRKVWISKIAFEEYAAAAGCKNVKPMLSILCDMGLMVKLSSGHYYRSHSLAGISALCYCVVLESKVSAKAPSKSIQNKKNKSAQMLSLLDDGTEQAG